MQRPRTSENSPSRTGLGDAADAVVATDPASVDSDYDNDAGLHGAPLYGRADERATNCVGNGCCNREEAYVLLPPPSVGGSQSGQREAPPTGR
jgi:hypothetical protein